MNGSDLLHVHAVDFFVDFLSLSRILHQHPLVLSTHGGYFHTRWLHRFKAAYFRTITRQTLKRVAAIVCVSEQDYEMFSSIVPKEKLHLVRNGVQVESYSAVRKSITPGLLVGIGRVSQNKGIDRLIRAIAKLRKNIRREIPKLVQEFNIRRLLDAPCGDYHWFRLIPRVNDFAYIGGDIVSPLIQRNQEASAGPTTGFVELDIITQAISTADIWLCRDAPFHFSDKQVFITG
jgi:glycosyltransferase involved in cell wall biosynthesis